MSQLASKKRKSANTDIDTSSSNKQKISSAAAVAVETVESLKARIAELERMLGRTEKNHRTACVNCEDVGFTRCVGCHGVLCDRCSNDDESRNCAGTVHPGETQCWECGGYVCRACERYCFDCINEDESTAYRCVNCDNGKMRIEVTCGCTWYTCGKHEDDTTHTWCCY